MLLFNALEWREYEARSAGMLRSRESTLLVATRVLISIGASFSFRVPLFSYYLRLHSYSIDSIVYSSADRRNLIIQEVPVFF